MILGIYIVIFSLLFLLKRCEMNIVFIFFLSRGNGCLCLDRLGKVRAHESLQIKIG